MAKKKKIAIVYDWLDKWGGVERMLLILRDMFPDADWYTSYFDPEKAPWAIGMNIKTSFIQYLPWFIKKNRMFSLLLYPYAFESFDFSSYDLVISVTSSFGKGIITKPSTRHICLLLTPTRFIWSHMNEYIPQNFLRSFATPIVDRVRRWDLVAAQRPDKIISISHTIKERCLTYYKRTSDVLYPPFDEKYWEEEKKELNLPIKIDPKVKKIIEAGNFFLIVSRLEPYKRIDIVIEAFQIYKEGTLVIAGEGREMKKLRNLGNENVIFLGRMNDSHLARLYTHAQALIMPQEEDFGYVALEAQYFGCPVIAYKKGGALETVVDGKTGIFFSEQTEKSLLTTLKRFHTISYNLKASTKEKGIESVRRFSVEKFKEKIKNFITVRTE